MSTLQDLLFGKKQSSDQIIDPALLTPEQRTQTIAGINQNVGSTFNPAQVGNNVDFSTSPYWQSLNDLVSGNTNYVPSPYENQLIKNVQDNTSAQFANRGLGTSPIAGSAVASSIAPTLVNLRQNNIQNMMQRLGIDIGERTGIRQGQLGLREQDINQRMQDIDNFLKTRGMNLESLLQLLNIGGKRTNLGSQTSGRTGGMLPNAFDSFGTQFGSNLAGNQNSSGGTSAIKALYGGGG